MYNVQDYSILYNNAARLIICESLNLLACVFLCIFALKGEVLAHKTSLTPSIIFEVPVQCQEIKRSCIYLLEVSNLPLSTILIFDFGIVSTVW